MGSSLQSLLLQLLVLVPRGAYLHSLICVFFFFSSRRRHTRWPRDWSSDVCSSDLGRGNRIGPVESGCAFPAREGPHTVRRSTPVTVTDDRVSRSRVTRHDDVPQDRLIHAVLELAVGSRVTNLETRLGEDRHDLFAGGHQGVPGNTQGTAGT